jgi:hypothetical protein
VQLGLVASGSLYGALGGSILAYRVADFLGELKSYTNLIFLTILITSTILIQEGE